MANQQLARSIENAELAIEYSGKYAVVLPADALLTVATAREAMEAGNVNKDLEVAFYEAYFVIAKAIEPATIGGIRDSSDLCGTRVRIWPWFWKWKTLSEARQAIRAFRWGTGIGLTLLLLAQIYWLVGDKTIRDIHAQTSIIKDKASEKEVEKDTAKGKEAEKAIQEAQLVQETDFFLLDQWTLLIPGRSHLETSLKQAGKDTTSQFSLDPDAVEFPAQKNRILLEISENTLSVYQVYVLPLLYGLLGAFAYVLRQLTVETRSRTFRVDSVPSYWLRVFLGMLAGLCIGWFFKPGQASPVVGDITPFALSFLAGYSVDVLFSAMDKIVDAFGTIAKTSKG